MTQLITTIVAKDRKIEPFHEGDAEIHISRQGNRKTLRIYEKQPEEIEAAKLEQPGCRRRMRIRRCAGASSSPKTE